MRLGICRMYFTETGLSWPFLPYLFCFVFLYRLRIRAQLSSFLAK